MGRRAGNGLLPLAAPFALHPTRRRWTRALLLKGTPVEDAVRGGLGPVLRVVVGCARRGASSHHCEAAHISGDGYPCVLPNWYTHTRPTTPAWATSLAPPRLRHCYRVVQVDVLDEVEEPHALRHRSLERLASRDEATASAALVQDSGTRGLGEVIVTRRAA